MHQNKIWQAVILSLLLHALIIVWLVQRNRAVTLRPPQPLLQFEMAASPLSGPAPLPPLPSQPPEPVQPQEPKRPQPAEEPLSVPNKPVPIQKPVKKHKPPLPRPAPVVERTTPVTSQPMTSADTTPAPSPPVERYQPPDLRAAYANNPKPVYPPSARRMGHEGTVLLTVDVTERGGVAQATIQSSSGFAVLDQAAVAAVSNWQFVPAQRNGHPTGARVIVPIRFQLQNE